MLLIVGLEIVTPARVAAQTFNDVPAEYWAFTFIETLAANGITAGCGGGDYCPQDAVTRAQMAVFLVRTFALDDAVELSYVFDDAAALSTPVPRGGGELLLTTGSGVAVTLAIPAETVFVDTDFSMTPVDAIDGLPDGFEPVVAVKLGPADRPFAAAPKITFDLPAGFRGDKLAIGFFTNDDGTEYYLSPLIGPDGLFAGNDVDLITLSKSSFSVGGLALIEDTNQQNQERNLSMAEQRAVDEITQIINEVVERQKMGGDITEDEKFRISTILNDWQADIERRLNLISQRIQANTHSDADLREGIALAGEQAELAVQAQMIGVEGDFLGDDILERLAAFLVDAIAASYNICNTGDEGQIEESRIFRVRLIGELQDMGRGGFVHGSDPGLVLDLENLGADIFECRYQIDLSPDFTRLLSETESTQVMLTGGAYNPVSRQLLPPMAGLAFEMLGDFQVEATGNVTLGELTGSTMHFLLEGPDVGSVTLSGGRIRNVGSASAQIVPQFAGEYTLGFSGSTSGCTDPEDDGPGSGQFMITIGASIVSIFDETVTHALDGSSNGATLMLNLTETVGQQSAPVNGNATFTETEFETVDIDGQIVNCTYVTNASAQLGGTATFDDESVSISVAPSNIINSYTGSPAICGSGSCSSVQGSATLTKSSPP